MKYRLNLLLIIALIFGGAPTAWGQAPTRERRAGPAGRSTAAEAGPRTLDDLTARLRALVNQPLLAAAQVSVDVASLDTGRTLFEANAGKLLMPASNMKIFTVAAALDRLSPDYRFRTSVYALAQPDQAGTVGGDLIVYGRGDPTIAARFNDGDYQRALDDLADRIVAAGVRNIGGDLVGDESYFRGSPLGRGWEWEDLQWHYGAEVTALALNDNAVDLTVGPGPKEGAPCVVAIGPRTPYVTVVNRTTTAPRGARRDLTVFRPLDRNVIEVSGSVGLGDQVFRVGSIAVVRPGQLFVEMLRDALTHRGVVIRGRARITDGVSGVTMPATARMVELASRESPPLGVIAAQTLKPSQNLYTELILRALGKAAAASDSQPTADAGIAAVQSFLRAAGIDQGSVMMADGSGLSRRDLITAAAAVRLLAYMSRHRYAAAFRDALPTAGVDGTLRNRFRGTPAAENLRAKTGTLDEVASLSGYVTSAAGERLVLSIIVNNYPDGFDPQGELIDPVAVLVASFAGRSQ